MLDHILLKKLMILLTIVKIPTKNRQEPGLWIVAALWNLTDCCFVVFKVKCLCCIFVSVLVFQFLCYIIFLIP